MQELSAHGLIELDAAAMTVVNGGDGPPFVPKPDDAWTWLVEKITGPMKMDPVLERQAV
jgi:hypothetical protein